MQTLLIDNYDSFTFNLYQMLAEVNGARPLVIRNDEMTWAEARRLEFDNIVLSPGPGHPANKRDFGICSDVLRESHVPLLGVCLGHQGLAYSYGANIIHAPEPMHGRLSPVFHNDSSLFDGIPQGFNVTRYHSLIVAEPLPACLEKIAWTGEIVMGLRRRDRPFWGVQFHPESICTEYGQRILENFRNLTATFYNLNKRQTHNKTWHGFAAPKPTKTSAWTVHSCKLARAYDPEQVYVHVMADESASFWLDSSRVEAGLSRFSFIGSGAGPFTKLITYQTASQKLQVNENGTISTISESIFNYLQRELQARACQSHDLPFDFNCGFVGYFGYELKKECGSELVHTSSYPDAMFLLADRLVVFDHQEQRTYLLCLSPTNDATAANQWFDEISRKLDELPPTPPIEPDQQQEPIDFRLHRPYQTYIDDIHHCQQRIKDGETYEACLTNQIHVDAALDPLVLYRILRRINPAPYAAFLRFGDMAVVCSSPERFLKIDREGQVESKPIKGTRPRGQNEQEDLLIRHELQTNIKDRSENLMIVDLLRNDLGAVCEIGSVHVPVLMGVETYQTVHQLVSTVRGKLRADASAIDCIKQAFPGGSMTGTPKLRTMEIIDELEQEARGVYSGALGFLGLNGSADLNIVIRTIIVTPKRASVGVGGAIVALSDPQDEFDEILVKARAPIQAIMLATGGTFDERMYQEVVEKFKCNSVNVFAPEEKNNNRTRVL